MAHNEGKIKYIFHVVNSVKGGCGKSTFSLWLAEYWRSRDEPVYIIDLDTDGTSWEDEYRAYFIETFDNVYINDVVDNYQKANYLRPWRLINSESLFCYDKHTSSHGTTIENVDNKIRICIADPRKRTASIGYEVDLFEQAIACLIKNIVDNEKNPGDKKNIVDNEKNPGDKKNIVDNEKNPGDKKSVHVIFDMAPGADKKSEMFIKQYLFTSQFLLYKGKYSAKVDYDIRLYMLSTLMASTIKSNFEYVAKMISKPSKFDSVFYNLMEQKKLQIRMIFNDTNNCDVNNYIELTDSICNKNQYEEIRNRPGLVYFATLPYTKNIPGKHKSLSQFSGFLPSSYKDAPLTCPKQEVLGLTKTSIYKINGAEEYPSINVIFGHIDKSINKDSIF